MASSVACASLLTHAQAKEFESPEILMLGDSQLSFGTGFEMIRFFDDFENRCEAHVDNKDVLSTITQMKKTLIGARSTTLRSWSTEEGATYDKLCKKDPNWGVNASIWGHMRDKSRKYIQIGESEHFDFCKSSTPPVTAMFEEGYNPKLLLINVLGNAASKWSGSPKGAELDLKGFLKLIPDDLPCVYIATMPTYTKKRNTRRLKAQNNLKKAMGKLGNRCTFVNTLDASTIGAIQSKAKYFRRNESGKVKDPFHPQRNAAELVLKMKERQICQAVVQSVLPHWKGMTLKGSEPKKENELQVLKAGLMQEITPKTNVLEEVKVVDKPKVVAVKKIEETKVEVSALKADVVEAPVVPKKLKAKIKPIFLMVRTLPNGESIESHKMIIQAHQAPINPKNTKPEDNIATLEKKSLKTTLEVNKTFIRGSVDLHFTNGETSTKLVQVKSQSNP